jgi:pyruvate,water dikinase
LALLRARLASSPASEELRRAAEDLCAAEAGPLAVRSSAVGEGASLSGQLSTFLGVRGPAALVMAVQACWLSRWSDTAVRYALSRGLELEQLRMGVLVQRLVQAEAAGSAHAAEGHIRIEGVWGLGRALAEGEVVPDVWWLEGGAIEAFRPGRKPLAAELDPSGGETWRRLSALQAETPCLGEPIVRQLARLIQAAEHVVSQPVELEWAVDGRKQPWLLQARPLTRAGAPAGRTKLQPLDGWVDGLPASGGAGLGRARVVRSAAEIQTLGPSDVLIARALPPGSLAGVARLAGLVLESGGTTSHAASLARERGIPAVLGARGATQCIGQGDAVLVEV